MKTKLLRKLRKGLFIVYMKSSDRNCSFNVYSGGFEKPYHIACWSTLEAAISTVHNNMIKRSKALKQRFVKREAENEKQLNLNLYQSKIYP